MTKHRFQTLFTLFCLLLLFLFPAASFEGAKRGLLLWFNIVLPTLLPFLIFSNLCVQLNITKTFSVFLYPVLKHIMPISPNGCYPIAIGMLSGYPMGAKACADMTSSGKISPAEGQFLLSFCNNASPMFLLNYLFLQSLHITKHLPIFMGIMLGSSLLCGYIYLLFHPCKQSQLHSTSISKKTPALPKKSYPKNEMKKSNKKEASAATTNSEASSIYIPSVTSSNNNSTVKPNTNPTYFQILDQSIMNGFEIITKIGGYIILFSLLANLICSYVPFSELTNAILIGTLEITTGIQYLSDASLAFPVKLMLATALSAFGGLSSVAQTGSVLLHSPLKLSTYVIYKLLNSVICLLGISVYLYLI